MAISSDKIFDESRIWIAVSFSSMFPSDADSVYRILSSISFNWRLLFALVTINVWRSSSSSGLQSRRHKTRIKYRLILSWDVSYSNMGEDKCLSLTDLCRKLLHIARVWVFTGRPNMSFYKPPKQQFQSTKDNHGLHEQHTRHSWCAASVVLRLASSANMSTMIIEKMNFTRVTHKLSFKFHFILHDIVSKISNLFSLHA